MTIRFLKSREGTIWSYIIYLAPIDFNETVTTIRVVVSSDFTIFYNLYTICFIEVRNNFMHVLTKYYG